MNRKRPFISIFVLLVIGISLTYFWESLLFGCIMFLSLFITWVIFEYLELNNKHLLFSLFILSVGYLACLFTYPTFQWDGAIYEVNAVVDDVNSVNNYWQVTANISYSLKKIILYLPENENIAQGDEISFVGEIKKPDKAQNPGEFCYRSFLERSNIYGICWPEQYTITSKKANFRFNIASIRQYIKRNLANNLNDDSLPRALILGDRQNLTDERVAIWQKLGINHLLAISGLHISLLAIVLWYLGSLLIPNRLYHHIIVGSCLLLYVLLLEGRPSAWRAFLAFIILTFSKWKNDSSEPLHVWSSVGFIMLTVNPSYLFEVGFQLSFLASGVIILYANLLIGYNKLVAMLAVSVIAQVGLAPLLINYFGQISLFAPIGTIIFMPFVCFVFLVGMLVGLFGEIATPLIWSINLVIQIVANLEDFFAEFPGLITLEQLNLKQIILWYYLVIGFGYVLRQKNIFGSKQTLTRGLIICLIFLLLCNLPSYLVRPLKVTVLNVGQGDAIHIETPLGQHILIDGGGDSVYWQRRGRNVGLERVIPYLEYRGVTEIDLIVLTHPHEDHLFGLLTVLEYFPVRLVVDNGQPHNTNSYSRYLNLIDQRLIPYKQANSGDILKFGNVKIDVLHPKQLLSGTQSDLNNNSLVLELEYRGRKLMFTGDIDREGQQVFLQQNELTEVDWIKVPHHGSLSAWYLPFYETISPDIAVISVGPNFYGHPHKEVINSLTAKNIKTYRTDIDGSVSFYIWNGLLGKVWWQ